MGLPDTTRFIERLGFFDGQRLEASDLSDIDTFNREMRWLHNKSLHQPGVGKGYAVTGKRGDREIGVGPGYAIDSQGREVVMTEELVLPVPAVAGDASGSGAVCFDLTIAYPDEAHLEEVETRQSDCSATGATRRREQPQFCWVQLAKVGDAFRPVLPARAKDILDGTAIVLARVCVANCSVDTLKLAPRRNAKLPRQPYVAAGRTTAADWKLANPMRKKAESDAKRASVSYTGGLGLEVTVDTTAARFVTRPIYQARIEGPRLKAVNGKHYIYEPLINIPLESATSTSFLAQVLVVRNPIGGSHDDGPVITSVSDETPAAQFRDWNVVWVGIEG